MFRTRSPGKHEEDGMRCLLMVLGFLTGKWKVRCFDCKHYDPMAGCHGHIIPDAVARRHITCGFYQSL